MGKKIRIEVWKVLQEEMGVQLEIKELSNSVTDLAISQIQLNKDTIVDGYSYEFSRSIRATDNQKEVTKIDSVVLNINYQKTDIAKYNGKFYSDKIKLQDNGLYIVYLELFIESPQIETINTTQINSIISHELNHAFVYIKKFNLGSKTMAYNGVKNKLRVLFQNTESLNRFMIMFYLNLPEEIQARVQEVGTLLQRIESDNYNDAVRELFLYQPINDAKRMVKYDSADVYKLPIETQQEFVKEFNKELLLYKNKFNYDGVEFKTINDPKKFFAYWTKFINLGGVKLSKKIVNIVAKKFNIDNDRVLSDLNDSLLEEIFIIKSKGFLND